MNTVILKGIIKNIEYSHTINGVDYDKADLIVKRADGTEDIISLRFKRFANKYENDQEIELVGNLRSYSRKLENGKNKVSVYVFTYFDVPEDDSITNHFQISGRICKMDPIHTTESGKQNIHFVVANNIVSSDGKVKINNYIPITCWGVTARYVKDMHVSDKVIIEGELHSRTYTKKNEDGELEILTAHEGIGTSVQVDNS